MFFYSKKLFELLKNLKVIKNENKMIVTVSFDGPKKLYAQKQKKIN